MPRLLVVTTSYPMQDNPTSGIFVAKILHYLPADWEITVLTPATAHDTAPRRDGRLTVCPVVYAPRTWMRLAHAPGGIMPQLRQHPWLGLLLPAMLLRLAWCLRRRAREHDMMYANWAIQGALAGLVTLGWHKPLVTALRGSDVHARQTLSQRLFLKMTAHFSSKITAVSDDFASTIESIMPSCGPIVVVQNGVDDALLTLPPPDRTLAQGLRLLSIGSLIAVKDHRTLLHALARLTTYPWHLRIVGEGPERRGLAQLAKELHIEDRIELLGAVSPAQIPGILAHHDVLIHPSRAEGRSNVVIEAMAAARAIIASDIPSQKELLGAGAGILFPPADVAALHDALASLTGHDLTTLGLSARRQILERGLTWPGAGRQLDGVLRGCLDTGEVR